MLVKLAFNAYRIVLVSIYIYTIISLSIIAIHFPELISYFFHVINKLKSSYPNAWADQRGPLGLTNGSYYRIMQRIMLSGLVRNQ